MNIKIVSLIALFGVIILSAGCGDDDTPPMENPEEIITDVTLTFTPTSGPSIVASAIDSDGDGPEELAINGSIVLATNTTYSLTIDLQNSIDGESITDEILEEAEEHMFFFGWQGGIFAAPNGDGNIEDRSDNVIYSDEDDNGLPLGLRTSWITADAATSTFRVILKHQPDGVKTETSESSDGDTDLDLTWDLSIE